MKKKSIKLLYVNDWCINYITQHCAALICWSTKPAKYTNGYELHATVIRVLKLSGEKGSTGERQTETERDERYGKSSVL